MPLPNPDFTALIQTLTRGLAATVEHGYEDKNLEGYVWEAAVEAVFGTAYWTWREALRG